MVLAALLQNICVFQAFSNRSTSGQSRARPPILVLPAFVDFEEI